MSCHMKNVTGGVFVDNETNTVSPFGSSHYRYTGGRSMNIAILGRGTMGTAYAHNLAKMPGVTVTGVVDINAGRAERAAL